MNINALLVSVLSVYGDPVADGVYQGSAAQYFTFNASSFGVDFGDDAPQHERHLVQVHFFCAADFRYTGRAQDVKKVLFQAGFTWPELTVITDEDGRHLVFECETALGVGVDG